MGISFVVTMEVNSSQVSRVLCNRTVPASLIQY